MDSSQDRRKRKDYVAYLLRLWRDNAEEGVPPAEWASWRASLQSAQTGEHIGFATLEAMFTYLREVAGENCPPHEEDRGGHEENGRVGEAIGNTS
jgi:hypothetical protein